MHLLQTVFFQQNVDETGVNEDFCDVGMRKIMQTYVYFRLLCQIINPTVTFVLRKYRS